MTSNVVASMMQQQQHQQQQQQQQQQQGNNGSKPVEPIPPRYQPPPQPQLAKSPTGQNHQFLQQQQHQPTHLELQLHHRAQAARLANQVKEAVQSKFAQKIELNHQATNGQQTRIDKPQQQQNQQQPQQQPQQQQQILGVNYLHPAAAKAYPNGHHQMPPTPTTPTPTTPVNGCSTNPPIGLPILPNGTVIPNSVIGHYQPHQQPTPQLIVGPRFRITDDEFLRLGSVEMLKFVRKTENDLARFAHEHHRQIQTLVNELRNLKEANQRLSDDNQELRDLCCFLDDDRQKGRKLAREWQRFGRYTASVMRQEVSAYQNKLRQLDNKQQELIKDNLELKELCLYLDEERGGGQRDDGDGSSSSTNAEETSAPTPRTATQHNAPTFNDQTMQYVKTLEQRVKQLEEDKSILQARAQGWSGVPSGEIWEAPNSPESDNLHLGSRPEAVVRALQVLEVREQLEREAGHDGEKALVREMCNVVWRKLEEGPASNRH